MSRRQLNPLLAALAASAVLALPVAARADVVSDVAQDLSVSGVPAAQVSLSAPTGEELSLRRANATAPILRVRYTPPTGTALTGMLPSLQTSYPLYTDTTGEEIVWELAIIEATKHAIARGASLGGLAMTTARPGGDEEAFTTALRIDTPEQQAPATLSLDAVETEASEALPQWASLAEITVRNDAVGERIIEVTLARPAAAFTLLDFSRAAQALAEKQIELAPAGGNVGRVIMRVNDTVTGDPLYVAAHDVLYGWLSQWYAPIVRAWSRPLISISEETPADTVSEAQAEVENITGTSPPPLGR